MEACHYMIMSASEAPVYMWVCLVDIMIVVLPLLDKNYKYIIVYNNVIKKDRWV